MEINTAIGLIAFFTFLTLMFAMYAIYAPVVNTKEEEIGEDIFSTVDAEIDSKDSIGKVVRPIVDNLLPQLPINLSKNQKRSLSRLIVTSGNPWKVTPEELIAVQIGLGVLGLLAGTLFSLLPGMSEAMPPLTLPIVLTLCGVMLPYSKYNSLREKRMKEIEKQLPDAIDLIRITVGTAGKTFESGLEQVTIHMPDNLVRREFTQCSVEMEAGQTTRDVLTALYKRFDSKDLETFCKGMIQSKVLGNDPSRTLEQQSNFIRDNYEARLDRMIARLESTMFMPLVLTMLPAFTLIFLAPSLSSITEYMG